MNSPVPQARRTEPLLPGQGSYGLDPSLIVVTMLGFLLTLPVLGLFALSSTLSHTIYSADSLLGTAVSILIVLAGITTPLWLLGKSWRVSVDGRLLSAISRRLLPELLASEPPRRGAALLAALTEALTSLDRTAGPRSPLLRRARTTLAGMTGSAQQVAPEEVAALRDRRDMESSNAIPRFFIWSMPILGFIGTVLGISDAISEFSLAMKGVSTAEVAVTLQEHLPRVTNHLAVAFYTTLWGLVFSMPSVLLQTLVERWEERHLNELDAIWFAVVVPGLRELPPTNHVLAAPEDRLSSELRALSAHIDALHNVVQHIQEQALHPAPSHAAAARR